MTRTYCPIVSGAMSTSTGTAGRSEVLHSGHGIRPVATQSGQVRHTVSSSTFRKPKASQFLQGIVELPVQTGHGSSDGGGGEGCGEG